MTNLQALDNEIRKAIPKLMELKEGFTFSFKGDSQINVIYILNVENGTVTYKNNRDYFCVVPIHKLKLDLFNAIIFGQEIQLIHVLKWLDKEVGMWNYIHGQVFYTQHLLRMWNLDENLLKNQSDELIDFLFNLIQK